MTQLAQQKDFTILRVQVNKPSGIYEYKLLYKGNIVSIRKDDRFFQYAAVCVTKTGPIIDSLRLSIGQFEPQQIEDNNTFIVEITVN